MLDEGAHSCDLGPDEGAVQNQLQMVQFYTVLKYFFIQNARQRRNTLMRAEQTRMRARTKFARYDIFGDSAGNKLRMLNVNRHLE